MEKFYGQTQQRSEGNLYFDTGDVTAVTKTVNLQNLLNNDQLPVRNNESGCLICMDLVDDNDLEVLHEYTVQDTQSFLHCDKKVFLQKIVSIPGHLVHKPDKSLHDAQDKKDISTEYLNKAVFLFPHYQQYFSLILHSKLIQKSFRKTEIQKLTQPFVCIHLCSSGKKTLILAQLNQYYHKSILLKQQWQRKRTEMFTKTRTANKVEVKNRTIIPVLICCFSVFLNHNSCKNSAYDREIFLFSTYIHGYVRPKLSPKQGIDMIWLECWLFLD